MTRYTKYNKRFNTTTISEEQIIQAEQQAVEASKSQSIDELRLSTTQRSKPVLIIALTINLCRSV
jgi:hypothetical protein